MPLFEQFTKIYVNYSVNRICPPPHYSLAWPTGYYVGPYGCSNTHIVNK